GASVLLDAEVAGPDVTEAFYGLHHHEVLEQPQYKRLQIGVIAGEESKLHSRIADKLSAVPYGEPTWLAAGYHSLYYSENHQKFQKEIRAFFDTVVYPDALLIITQEFARSLLRGYVDGLLGGKVIGLPPVLNFGSEELKAKVVPEVLSGKKFSCLAILEAHAGSDVMGLQTTAVKSEDGKEWIITGSKKWIMNGTFVDYFTIGCKTEDGFTVILVECGPGVETKQIKT
ncbi:hypothetical protein H0H92_011329, partial [Tricholoma furcatifolium]